MNGIQSQKFSGGEPLDSRLKGRGRARAPPNIQTCPRPCLHILWTIDILSMSHVSSLVTSILTGNSHHLLEELFQSLPYGTIYNRHKARIGMGKKRFSFFCLKNQYKLFNVSLKIYFGHTRVIMEELPVLQIFPTEFFLPVTICFIMAAV